MLAHAQIVIGAPYRDRLWPIMARKAAGIGEGALVAQDVNKHPVATFLMEAVNRGVEYLAVIHGLILRANFFCHYLVGSLKASENDSQLTFGHVLDRIDQGTSSPPLKSCTALP